MSTDAPTALRALTQADQPALLALCEREPVANLFVAARASRYGVERSRLGCTIRGHFAAGQLRAAFHVGANLVPVNADAEAIEDYVRSDGGYRGSNSIMGPAGQVMALYERLCARGSSHWRRPRDVRPRQPLMVSDAEPLEPADPRVRPVGLADLETYFDASVRMYTEEVGVSPLGPDMSYAEHVRQTVVERRAFGIFEAGTCVFKADIGVELGHVSQIQGVWLDPALRGRGIASGAMSGVVGLARRRTPIVSLYVNDYNLPALRTYRRVGFRQVGEFATVLY